MYTFRLSTIMLSTPSSNGVMAQLLRSRLKRARPIAIPHPEERHDYWFVFYSERMDMIWILSSAEFLSESIANKSGKNVGLRSIWFNGRRKNPKTFVPELYCKARYEKYLATDFTRIRGPLAANS